MEKLWNIISIIFICVLTNISFAQGILQTTQKDTTRLTYPIKDNRYTPFAKSRYAIDFNSPANISREYIYDTNTKKYIIQDKIGSSLFRAPLIYSIDDFKKEEFKRLEKLYWKNKSSNLITQNRLNNYFPTIEIRNPAFEKAFGSSKIDLRPKGSVDVSLIARNDKSQNPLLAERYRSIWGIDFDQNINLGLIGNLGDRAKITANFNAQAEFDFENQIRFDYQGKSDDILQKLEVGNVNLRLPTQLIQGTESLFGIKSQLQFGKLNVVGIAAQQRAKKKEIILQNGKREQEISISLSNYEENQHYFLAQYFKDNYAKSLQYAPSITSGIQITQIEVWISNTSNNLLNSRNITALMDLGEASPYNPILNTASNSKLPSTGIPNQQAAIISNNLLQLIGDDGRNHNTSFLQSFFGGSNALDNYAKITSAKKLEEGKDFTLNKNLGYISLFTALHQDQILAVSYRYIHNGKEYQVGEFTTDLPQQDNGTTALYAKLLKNININTMLPTWKLMMKNIYSLNTSQLSDQDLKLQIYYTDKKTGTQTPILNEKSDLNWLHILGLDKLSQNFSPGADGIIDFLPTITIDNVKGKLIFPTDEPFGKDLYNTIKDDNISEKYAFEELYTLRKYEAQQLHTDKDRFRLSGKVSSNSDNTSYNLGVFNLKENSIKVEANGTMLAEGIQYEVDYASGTLYLINQGTLYSNQTLKVTIDDDDIFGFQQKTLLGARFDYAANQHLNIGATVLKLSEKPFSEKITIGNEPLSNTMIGADIQYSKTSRWLTRMMNKLPFFNLNEPSEINFYGELAYFKPSVSAGIASTSQGTSYIDDFENSFSYIDIKHQAGWQISGTPQLFPESKFVNDLAYGYNRAHLSFYNIDPIFYQHNTNSEPLDQKFLTDHRTRKVTEKEVFPYKEVKTGDDAYLSTLDLAFYPMLRGTYNFSTTNIDIQDRLLEPKKRWGGMFRKIDKNDFENQNIEFLEMWIMDPALTNPNKSGGDMYINLGDISEDILKDGRKSLENSLGTLSETIHDQTVWGKVSKHQPINQSFENDEHKREQQDIGLDGLNNFEEKDHFKNFLQQIKSIISPQQYDVLDKDPAGDDYIHYRGDHFNSQHGILERYKFYNGTQGNSRTSQQSQRDYNLSNASKTPYPDGEDIDRDNNMNENESYYQYRISTRPQDLIVGQNYIVDEQTSRITVLNKNVDVKWYKIRIPIREYDTKIGQIDDFKSIRFVRLFMTNYEDTAVIRFSKLQFVKGNWRSYNIENSAAKIISAYELGTIANDNSLLNLSNINIEENGKRHPIPYVVPPGINRQVDYANNNLDVQLNEQSLQLDIKNLKDGFGRAAYKTTSYDFRAYKHLELFIHAEGESLRDSDTRGFVRIGTDDRYNYYEYDKPLSITPYGATNSSLVWPAQNNMVIELSLLQKAKIQRDKALKDGNPWPLDIPFSYFDGESKITILGSPDLSNIKLLMLGIHNPLKGTSSSSMIDDGNEISGTFWFNELRLTGFDSKAGWAATAQLNIKLAEFANIMVSSHKMTNAFGQLHQTFSQGNRTDRFSYDITTNAELGKALPNKLQLSIPFYFNFSNQIQTPEYNPFQPDIELSSTIAALNRFQRDSLYNLVQDVTTRKSISFMNVRKTTNSEKYIKPWSTENISLSYSFNELQNRDFNTSSAIRKNYRGLFDYSYTNPKLNFKEPFKNDSSFLAPLLRKMNFNLMPSLMNFRMEVNRIYSENTFRDNANSNILPTYYAKNFNINRIYGISWDLTKSLRLDFNATNYAIIDEPNGRIDGIKTDTLWSNFWKLGRTTDYNHMLNITYALPFNKFKNLNWISIQTRYGTQFNWSGEPLITKLNANIDLGNSIQNNRTIQINPTLNFNNLYNKFSFYRKLSKSSNDGLIPSLLQFGLLVKQFNAAYTKMEGTYLPGYSPNTNIFGYSFNSNAPGIGFLFGSQANILEKAINNNWTTVDSLQTNLYTKTYAQNISYVTNLEPVKGLRIDLTGSKIDNKNSSIGITSNARPYITGNFSVSQINVNNVFQNDKSLFEKFENLKQLVSYELGLRNINSVGNSSLLYADGYNGNQQDVIVNAFIKTYVSNKVKIDKTNNKPNFPLPNWRITYTRLPHLLGISDWINAIYIHHSYQSQYVVSGYNSSALYKEENGSVYSRDLNNNFHPALQYQQINLIDRFTPLLGLDVRFKSNMTITTEYRKSRDINLSIGNSQLAILNEKSFIVGFGFRKTKSQLPFNWASDKKWNNDLNFKLDLAINDRKTSVFRNEKNYEEIYGGNKSLTLNPALDYTINKLYTIRLFYNANSIKPYTTDTYTTSYSYFGINFRLQFQ